MIVSAGNNPLTRQLFEIDVPTEALTSGIPPTCPALWRYRTQVTFDHFAHTFQQEVLSTDPERNKVLAEFLREVNHIELLSLPIFTYISYVCFQGTIFAFEVRNLL